MALNILSNNHYNIANDETLEYVIMIFLQVTIFNYPFLIKCILKYYHIFYLEKTYLKKYQLFLKNNYDRIYKTIKRFIELFKASNKNNKNLKNIIRNTKNKSDIKFLLVIYAIYLEYENELGATNSIDFNDMINLAILNVSNYSKEYKYIIVDEYQDTSISRNQLLQALVKKMKAQIMMVGDDWQAIYAFNGCYVNNFYDSFNLFNNLKLLYINTTYRNSQSLINIAGLFIMKNKIQIKKELKASKEIINPINIIYYKIIKKDLSILMNKLSKKGSVLILGRNNFDLKRYLDTNIYDIDKEGYIYLKNKKETNIRYLTIHKAKGLESDNVVIINLENNYYGFPSKVMDENILKYLKNNNLEDFKYSEERRLFYVALTRCKEKVYLYVPKYNESIFVKEIKKYIKKRKSSKKV